MTAKQTKLEKVELLKTLVGSRAHGLHTEDSDYDYRGVYVNSTEDILSLGYTYKGSSWVEGESEDNTAYEIGHFLHLATKCNPTILEVFKAPLIGSNAFGDELREIFPYIWNPEDVFNAFTGYGYNQRKKMLKREDDNRGAKYATAYLSTLYHLKQLLTTGDFSLEIPEGPFKDHLERVKSGKFKPGEIIDYADRMTTDCAICRERSKQVPNLTKVHEFLMKVRKHYWEL